MVNAPLTTRRSRRACGGSAIVVLLLSVVWAGMAGAGESGVTIRDAWARAPAVPGRNGAAYLTLVNRGDAAHRLVAVETAASERAELHRSVMADGVMKMMARESIAVPAGETTVLEPGGFHIMLIGASDSVEAGSTIPLTLRFAEGATRRVRADVVGPGRTPDMAE